MFILTSGKFPIVATFLCHPRKDPRDGNAKICYANQPFLVRG